MYRLYVDEVGTDDLTNFSRDHYRYLSLTGIAMKRDHARDYLGPAMDLIKARVFEHDPDEPLVFHRKDLMRLKGEYACLSDANKRRDFNDSLLSIIKKGEYTVITALIDKPWMIKQCHWRSKHPYHYLMEILVEKYARFLIRKRDIGDIMPEARQGPKDISLQKAFDEVRAAGTYYCSAANIQSAIRSKSLKFRTKKHNIAGLQLCDLIAHPSHIYTRLQMGHDVNPGVFANLILDELIERKYDRSSDGRTIMGYGIKCLP